MGECLHRRPRNGGSGFGTFTLADAERSQRSLRVDSINCK